MDMRDRRLAVIGKELAFQCQLDDLTDAEDKFFAAVFALREVAKVLADELNLTDPRALLAEASDED